MFAPFVLNLRTNFYQQGGGVKKWRGQLRRELVVLFTQESASKEGLFTLKEYGERMMKG